MSYRKITVNDKQYEYVIGKTHTKIKGKGLFKNSEVGVPLKRRVGDEVKESFVVTPAIVADLIAGKPIRPMHKCYHGTVTSKTMINPYDHEVYGERNTIGKCHLCHEALSDDI